jgi:hypothetical protein
MTIPHLVGLERLDRVGHAGLERSGRQRELNASHPTDRIVLLDERDQLLAARDGQLLAGQPSLLQALEELIHTDLLEQEPSGVEDVLALADHVILHREELIGQRSTVRITVGVNLELALTIHGQELLHLGHLSSFRQPT